MLKKKYWFMALLTILMIALVGCSATPDTSAPQQTEKKETAENKQEESSEARPSNYRLNFATGTTTGIYYPLGAILSDLWTKELSYVTAASQASNGSVQNLNFLQEKEVQVGIATIGSIYEAYNGERAFEGRDYKDVRILGGVYLNYTYFIGRKGAVESVADIKGKSFAPGATGSSTEIESQQVLGEYGISLDDTRNSFVGFTEATDLMRNRQVDGAMVQAGIPTSAVSEMLSTADGVIISFEDEIIEKLKAKYPWYLDTVIPAGTYDNQDNDVNTVAQFNFLIADASMPDEVAYDLVKTLWENLEKIEGSHGVIKQFSIDIAASGTAEVPLHPGAEKYYKEKGIIN